MLRQPQLAATRSACSRQGQGMAGGRQQHTISGGAGRAAPDWSARLPACLLEAAPLVRCHSMLSSHCPAGQLASRSSLRPMPSRRLQGATAKLLR